MSRRHAESEVERLWRRTGPIRRLLIGFAVLMLIWFAGLLQTGLTGLALPWPYVLLAASVGWGRSGLSLRPMFAILLLGLAQDLSHAAPFGSFAIAGLAIYGFHASFTRSVDLERDPVLSAVMPFVSLTLGVILVWILASNVAGHTAEFGPLAASWLATLALYAIARPVLDLGSRASSTARGG